MPKTSEAFRAAQARKRQGLPLSVADRQALTEQEKHYESRAVKIYFETSEQLAQWQTLAEQEGYPRFSAWVVAKVKIAVNGDVVDPVAHGRLQSKVQALEKDAEYHRRRSQEVEGENRDLKNEARRLSNEIMELTQWLRQDKQAPARKGKA
jgi:primosomal protein N''